MKRNDTTHRTGTRRSRAVVISRAISRAVAVAFAGALLLNLGGCDKPADPAHAPVKSDTPPIAESALAKAAIQGDLAEIKTLLDAGADVNAKDRIEDSPYLYAGARGHLDILKMTLTHGADIKSINRYGGTALIPASERGHVETVRTLIEAGVDVDHVNRLGWTALLEAVILGDGGVRHQKIVDLLVKAGADVGLADNEGVTPLQHARMRGYKEIEARLLAASGH